jgi:hypothetical protein
MPSRIFQLLLVAGLLVSASWAATDSFVGQWKLNPSRSKLTDEMKVTKLGQDKYAFDFGGGQPETIVVDGTDQPGFANTTLSVAAVGPSWRVIRKMDGRIVITATWALSKDGKFLTDNFTNLGQDGTPSKVKFVYKRVAGGGPGFAGDWVSTSEEVTSGFTLQISPYEGDGLTFAGMGATRNVKFDGKSARRLSANALDRNEMYQGKVIQTKQYNLSPDLKTLTIIVHTVGHTVPNVFVFERQ